MGVSKVTLNGETLMDITDTTAEDYDVTKNERFYAANGEETYGISTRDVQVKYAVNVYAQSNITAGNIIVANSTGRYCHLSNCVNFDIQQPILYANSDISADETGVDNYIMINFLVGTTQTITLTPYKPVYIKGTLNGTTFTPVSASPLTQTVPNANANVANSDEATAIESDSYQYILLGIAGSTNSIYLLSEHPVYAFLDNAFQTTEAWLMNRLMNGFTVGDFARL